MTPASATWMAAGGGGRKRRKRAESAGDCGVVGDCAVRRKRARARQRMLSRSPYMYAAKPRARVSAIAWRAASQRRCLKPPRTIAAAVAVPCSPRQYASVSAAATLPSSYTSPPTFCRCRRHARRGASRRRRFAPAALRPPVAPSASMPSSFAAVTLPLVVYLLSEVSASCSTQRSHLRLRPKWRSGRDGRGARVA